MTTATIHRQGDADAPTCPSEGHGQMVPRSLETQTYEQTFCGTWFDCTQPRCRNSRLTVSRELEHQLLAGAASPGSPRRSARWL